MVLTNGVDGLEETRLGERVPTTGVPPVPGARNLGAEYESVICRYIRVGLTQQVANGVGHINPSCLRKMRLSYTD